MTESAKPTVPTSAAKPPQRAVAICWFRREDYEAAKSAMSDPDRLYDNYDEWLREAHAFEREMAEQNVKAHRIRFDPVGFGLFCATRKIVADGTARAQWAASEAAKRVAPKS